MATRPSTLDCTPVPVPVCHNVGVQCTESKRISRTWSLPAVPCRRRRRRCSRRQLSARARSPYASLRDRELTAGNTKPEVEFLREDARSQSMADVGGLLSSATSRLVFGSGSVTAATSFQTCIDEDEEELALTTSSTDSDPPVTVLQEPSPRCRGVARVKSAASPGLRPPRQDCHRLCPPASGSRDRRSASVGTVRPSTNARSRFNKCDADFGEMLTSIILHYMMAQKIGTIFVVESLVILLLQIFS